MHMVFCAKAFNPKFLVYAFFFVYMKIITEGLSVLLLDISDKGTENTN